MTWPYMPYIVILLVAAVISAMLAVYAWRHRPAPGAGSLTVLMLAGVEWSLASVPELTSSDLPTKLFWSRVEYIGICTAPLAWLAFALQYTGRGRWLTRRSAVLLTVVPLITLLLAFTSDWHDWFWSNPRLETIAPSLTVLVVDHGAWFWVNSAFSYAAVLLGIILLVRMLPRSASVFRLQAIALLLSVSVITVTSLLYVSGYNPISPLNPTSLALVLTGLIVAWGLSRLQLLDLVPAAREAVIVSMSDGMIALDAQDRIVDINAAAQQMVGIAASQAIGRPIAQVLRIWSDSVERYLDKSKARLEISLGEKAAQRHYELRVSPLTDRFGLYSGRLLLLHDITEYKRIEADLARRVTQLAFLSDVTGKLAMVLDLASLLDRAANLVQSSFGYPRVALFLLDHEQGELVMQARAGDFPENFPSDCRIKLGHGVTGWVGEHGKTLLVNDARAEPRHADLCTDMPILSEMGVPIQVGERRIGVLDIQSPYPDAFDENDVMVMETLAGQVAIAIENARLYEAAQRELAERKRTEAELLAQKRLLENLVAVARATAERPTLEATLQNALDVAIVLTGAELGDLFLVNEDGVMVGSAATGGQITEQRQESINQVMDRGLAGWVARHRQPVLIADTAQDERWLPLPGRTAAVRSALAVPILSGELLLGVLILAHSQPAYLTTEHLHLMQSAADQMALAVRNAQIFDAQRRMAEREITLYQVLSVVSKQLDLGAVARAAVEAIAQFASWPHVVIALPDESQTHLIARAASGVLSKAVGLAVPIEQSVIGRAFRMAQTQFVYDVRADPDYVAMQPAVRSELAIPLRRGERVLGVLDLASDQLAAFSADDVLLAESLADAVALALDNARLYSEMRQHAANLSALYALTRATSRSLALEDVLSQALALTLMSLDLDAGLISLAEPDDKGEGGASRLRVVAQRGIPSAYLEHLQREGLENTLCAYVYSSRESLIIGDVEQDAPPAVREMATRMVALGWRGYVGIPLMLYEQPIGVISLFSHQARPSSAYDLTLLMGVGQQIATAVANARLFQSTLLERSRLQALIKSSRDGVILIGMDGRLLVINEPALRLLRLPGSPEDWLSRRLVEALVVLRVYAPPAARTVLAEARRIRQGDNSTSEGELEVPPHIFHWTSSPVMAGALTVGRLVLLHDVTNERAAERLRQDMTHTMVHDLRNPLSSISVALEFLAEDTAALLSTEQSELLNIARQSADKMLELINSILDISRLESGQMPITRIWFHVGDLVRDTIRAQMPLAVKKGLRLESNVPADLPPAWADVGLIRRVLQNLVGNAVRFTPDGGLIRVTAGMEERAGRPVLLVSVSDNGPGIPPEIRGRLFQRFVTGSQDEHGSGLGLAFCKLVVEAHGGRIWVDSTPGQGTTFTFSLATSAS